MEGLLKPRGSFKGRKPEEKSIVGGVAGKAATSSVNFDEEDDEDFEDHNE